MFRRLAAAMGFDDPHFRQTDEAMLADVLDWSAPLLRGHTLASLKSRGYIRVNTAAPQAYAPHAHGAFPTPSGKCELRLSDVAPSNFVAPVLRQMSTDAEPETLDPLPGFATPDAVPCTMRPTDARYPLQLLTPKSHGFLNSEYANEDRKVRAQGEQFVLIHPDAARTRGIAEGETVRVHNDRGEFVAVARLSDAVGPALAVATYGYWPSRNRGNAVNATTPNESLGLGHAPTSFHNAVEITRLT
jgi:anaerobic selenocysteine-containing dehydrogenase